MADPPHCHVRIRFVFVYCGCVVFSFFLYWSFTLSPGRWHALINYAAVDFGSHLNLSRFTRCKTRVVLGFCWIIRCDKTRRERGRRALYNRFCVCVLLYYSSPDRVGSSTPLQSLLRTRLCHLGTRPFIIRCWREKRERKTYNYVTGGRVHHRFLSEISLCLHKKKRVTSVTHAAVFASWWELITCCTTHAG